MRNSVRLLACGIAAAAAVTVGGCKYQDNPNVYKPATAPEDLTAPPSDLDLRVVSVGYSRGNNLHTVTCAPAGQTLRSAATVWEYQIPASEAYQPWMGKPCPTDQPLVAKF